MKNAPRTLGVNHTYSFTLVHQFTLNPRACHRAPVWVTVSLENHTCLSTRRESVSTENQTVDCG
jgi:hypothetical protein